MQGSGPSLRIAVRLCAFLLPTSSFTQPVDTSSGSFASPPPFEPSAAGYESPASLLAAPPNPYNPAGVDSDFTVPGFVRALAANPLRWGPFHVHPSANYRFSYSTGLPGARAAAGGDSTIRHSVSPGIALQSEHLTLSYSPTFSYFPHGRYEDSLAHRVSLASSFGYGDWRFRLNHSYSDNSLILVETGAQTDIESHRSSAGASYRFSEKSSIDLSVSQVINTSNGSVGGASLNSSTTWSTMNWFNYQITDVTQLGLGLGGGFSAVELGSDMSFQQIQSRLRWSPRLKISLSLNGGIEIRQFLGPEGANDLVNPVMGASAAYRPFENTSFTLSANRGVGASLFSDTVTESTSFSASLGQRLFGHVRAGLTGGVRLVDYLSSSAGQPASPFANRSDNVNFVSASLGTTIFKRATLSLSYSHNRNRSNLQRFTYESNTYSAQVGYSF